MADNREKSSIPWSHPLFNRILFHSSIELDDCGCSDDKLLRLTHSQTSPTIQLKLKNSQHSRSLARSCSCICYSNTPLPPSTWNEIKQIWSWKISPLSLATNRSYNPGSPLAVRVCSRYVYNIRANRMCKCVTANRGGLRFCGLRVPTGSPAAIKILLALICFSFSFCG